MPVVFETERLLFRELVVDDAANVFALNSNPLVMRYTGSYPMGSIDEAIGFITNYTDYQNFGYGRWACVLKGTNTFIGVFGLRYFKEDNEVDIGGLFLPEYWNKGYAKEAAAACINFGFNLIKVDEISAKCSAENIASQKIMESLGMVLTKEYFSGTTKVLYYTIRRNE
ncbi:MAG: GNAT family N-acetyltransferase [Sphingobacteriales bacterium JAD_PAG50586_3]|nr:MAG: GNAT family N-acetyltransferase [Sphingobacteriales bacterium JAD_PAG50586_3]